MNRKIKQLIGCAILVSALASCQKEEFKPSQKEIETNVVGKWKRVRLNNEECTTNLRQIATFNNDGTMYSTTTLTSTGKSLWEVKSPFEYTCYDNKIRSICYFEDGTMRSELNFKVEEINQEKLRVLLYRNFTDGEYRDNNTLIEYKRVTDDFSEQIIGLWEGDELLGEETFGGVNHRMEFKQDGSYVYYNFESGNWVPSADVDNVFVVDGDWLACKWRPQAGADFEYERWDIDSIKDGSMVWSAIREKEDGMRYTTTFTWKRVIE